MTTKQNKAALLSIETLKKSALTTGKKQLLPDGLTVEAHFLNGKVPQLYVAGTCGGQRLSVPYDLFMKTKGSYNSVLLNFEKKKSSETPNELILMLAAEKAKTGFILKDCLPKNKKQFSEVFRTYRKLESMAARLAGLPIVSKEIKGFIEQEFNGAKVAITRLFSKVTDDTVDINVTATPKEVTEWFWRRILSEPVKNESAQGLIQPTPKDEGNSPETLEHWVFASIERFPYFLPTEIDATGPVKDLVSYGFEYYKSVLKEVQKTIPDILDQNTQEGKYLKQFRIPIPKSWSLTGRWYATKEVSVASLINEKTIPSKIRTSAVTSPIKAMYFTYLLRSGVFPRDGTKPGKESNPLRILVGPERFDRKLDEAKAEGKSQQAKKAELAKELHLDKHAIMAGFGQPSVLTVGVNGAYQKVTDEKDANLLPTLFSRNFIDCKVPTPQIPTEERPTGTLTLTVLPRTFPQPSEDAIEAARKTTSTLFPPPKEKKERKAQRTSVAPHPELFNIWNSIPSGLIKKAKALRLRAGGEVSKQSVALLCMYAGTVADPYDSDHDSDSDLD